MRKIASHRIVYTRDEIDAAKDALDQIMSSGWMILGDHTKEFERVYAELHGRKYGVAVASDTAALEIALRVYGVGEGDKVLFPANGFYGIVIPILRVGAVPVFFDIDIEENLFATTERIESLLDEHQDTKCLLLMHCGGMVASESERIAEICKERGVICLEDAAHAPGALQNGRPAGSFGDASAFSLYATKPINAGEGGILLLDDEEKAELARVYRNYGRVADFGRSICKYEGYSWRITEIQAVIGTGQVRRQAEIRKEREMLAARYDEMIAPLLDLGIEKYEMKPGSEPNWYRYLLLLPKGFEHRHREAMKAHIKKEYGVDLPGEVYELTVPEQPVWAGAYEDQSFPNSEDWANRHFALPLYNRLQKVEQQWVVQSVARGFTALQNGELGEL